MTTLYTDGTVSVTSTSNIVTGSGTLFQSIGDIKIGDLFTLDGSNFYEIYAITSETQFSIRTIPGKQPFQGSTASGLSYAVIRNFTSTTSASLAVKLAAIQNKWHQREEDITGWIVSDAASYSVTDVFGNQSDIVTPAEITRIASQATTVSTNMAVVEARIDQAEIDLDGVTPSINSFYSAKSTFDFDLATAYTNLNTYQTNASNSADAAASSESTVAASAAAALLSENNAATSETNAQSWYNQAQSAVDTVGSVNKTMNFLNFYIDTDGSLMCQYNGVQDSSAFNINANGELEVTI